MPDIFHLIAKWKREIVFLVLLSTITTAVIVFIIPPKYLALSTALPANAAAADKSTVFNNSIQELYSTLGNPDDLDKILGTGQLDTVYIATAEEFGLAAHFDVKDKERSAILKAATVLKKNTKVSKSEFGELQVRVWDRDRNLAPKLANSIMEKLGLIHQNLQSEGNRSIISSLKNSKKALQESIDQLKTVLQHGEYPAGQQSLLLEDLNSKKESMHQYDKLIGEYQLMIDTKPAALMVVEKARPANWPDKPQRVLLIVAAVALSFLFSLLIAVALERRSIKKGESR